MADEVAEEPFPVQLFPARKQQVGDVGAVEALALLDERLGPNYLFGWA